MLIGIVLIATIAGMLGTLLLWAESRWPAEPDGDVGRVNGLLPQTQCGQCGYPGCRPYAAAIVAGQAPINRCPPGGEQVIRSLADLLGSKPLPLDTGCGEHRPRVVARIVEATCIGCARCIDVCPVDAIIGAHRFTHTVVAAACTGCEICVPACPVDCIAIVAAKDTPHAAWIPPRIAAHESAG